MAAVPRDRIPATGLTVIYEPPAEATLDVVFVHGFTGHPVRTWTHSGGSKQPENTSEPPPKARKLTPFSRPHQQEKSSLSATSVYWPQDLLPKTIPQARVSTFGYDTNIRHKHVGPVLNKSTIYDMAKGFLSELEAKRRSHTTRPLLFIAHSLGGLMVKEALRQAYHNRNVHLELRAIFDSTIGIFFFGTPHRGADPRGLVVGIIEKLAKGLGFEANQHVLNTLLPDSECRQLRDEFNPVLQDQNWIIYSFQEGLALSGLGQKVVESSSSELNFPKSEMTVTIGKDHREMCRFPCLNDTEYQKVEAALTRIAQQVSKIQVTSDVGASVPSPDGEATPKVTSLSKQSIQILLDSLRFDQIDSRQESIKMAHRNTCGWITKTRKYKDWLDIKKMPDHHGFLWMRGKAGSGKSTLMKSTLRSFQRSKQNSGTTIIYFFFNARGTELEKTTEGMYRSLLLQLLEKMPHIQNTVFESAAIEPWNVREGREWPIGILEEVFENAILSIGQETVTCFIDALDECDDDEVEPMIRLFERVGEQAVSQGLRFRIFFSSRPYPDISLTTCLDLSLDGQDGHVQDLTTYIQNELKVDDRKIKKQLLEKASGIFMWAVLVVDILNKEKRKGKPNHLLTRKLEEIPRGLYELFRSILTRDGEDKDLLLLSIQWLLFTREPLGPQQFYGAILSGVESGEDPDSDSESSSNNKSTSNGDSNSEDDSESDNASPSGNDTTLMSEDAMPTTTPDIPRFVRNISKGLAEVTQSKKAPVVQFIHESVREFLLKDGLREVWPELDGNFEAQSHEILKLCCLKYLRGDISVKLGIRCDLPLPKAPTKEASTLREKATTDFPFLEYATKNILWHSECAQNQELGSVSQAEFLEREFDLRTWLLLRNVLEKKEVRRYRYTYTATLLYVLAELNLPTLISVRLHACDPLALLATESERYGSPLLAAMVFRSQGAIDAFVDHLGALQQTPASLIKTWRQETRITSSLLNGFEFSKEKRHLFSYAAEYGDVALFHLLLAMPELNVDVNETDKRSLPPLAYAAKKGHTAFVKFLCDSGAAIDLEPLKLACENGHYDVAKILLETGAHAQARDQLGHGLRNAASGGHLAVVKLLLDHGVEVDAKDDTQYTPLMEAASHGKLDVVEFLLKKGADIKAVDIHGISAIGMTGYLDSLKMRQLIELAGLGNLNDWRDDAGRCLLSYAVDKVNVDVIKFLLETHNVDVNSRDRKGRTPLHYLLRNYRKFWHGEECLRLLFNTGDLELDHPDEDGQTPLHLAAGLLDGVEIMELLLNSGRVEVDRKNNQGRTPLSLAAGNGNTKIVKLLLTTEIMQVDAGDEGARTSLSYDAEGDPSARHVLETRKADPNSTDVDGQTPLSWAARQCHADIVELLLATDGIDMNAGDNRGWTPFMYAVHYRKEVRWAWYETDRIPRLVSAFLNTGRVNLDLVNNDGQTALDIAATSQWDFWMTKLEEWADPDEMVINLLKEYKLKQQTSGFRV